MMTRPITPASIGSAAMVPSDGIQRQVREQHAIRVRNRSTVMKNKILMMGIGLCVLAASAIGHGQR